MSGDVVPMNNGLLAMMSETDLTTMKSQFEYVELPRETILLAPDRTQDYVYLLESGLASRIATGAGGVGRGPRPSRASNRALTRQGPISAGRRQTSAHLRNSGNHDRRSARERLERRAKSRKSGIVRTRRLAIEVLDRAKLVEVATERYVAPEAEYRRIIGPS
jgi:hypothetical protein